MVIRGPHSLITIPTQTMHFSEEIPQIHHIFALFDPPTNGKFNDPTTTTIFFWDRQKATSFGTSFEFCMERSCSENKTFQIYLVSLQVYLEPETSVYKWLFQLDDSKSLHKKMVVSPNIHQKNVV